MKRVFSPGQHVYFCFVTHFCLYFTGKFYAAADDFCNFP